MRSRFLLARGHAVAKRTYQQQDACLQDPNVVSLARKRRVAIVIANVEFRLGDYQHELGIIDSKYVPGIESTNGRAGVVVYWHVDDVNAALDKAVAMGATQLEAPQDRGEGFITATAVDPFGNILGIMYNPHYLEILASFKRA